MMKFWSLVVLRPISFPGLPVFWVSFRFESKERQSTGKKPLQMSWILKCTMKMPVRLLVLISPNFTPTSTLGSSFNLPFGCSTKFGQISNIRAYENDLEIGSLDLSTGTASNISYDQIKDQYLLSWTSSYKGKHNLYLRVDFEDGTTVFSTPVSVEIIEGTVGDQLPSISLRQPLDGTSITDISSIRLEANASDPDGAITQVEFYVNGELNATVDYNASFLQPNFAYGTTWSPDANGTYHIHAVAVDNGGNRVMSEVATVYVVPGSDAPVASLTDLSGTNYYEGDSLFFSLSSLEDNASTGGEGVITEVSFYVNGQLVGAPAIDFPYVSVWTPNEPGFYEFYARVRDNEGNTVVTDIQQMVIFKDITTTIDLLFPNPSISHSFAPQSNLPVVANLDYNHSTVGSVMAVVNNSQNINLTEEGGQYSSGRWTGYINNLNPGTHSGSFNCQ